VLTSAGRPGEAAGVLEPLVAAHPGSFDLAQALAGADLADGRTRKAVEAMERVRPFVSDNGQRVQLLMFEAQVFGKDGRKAKQLDAYRSASRLQPSQPGLHYEAARLLEGMGRVGEALDEVREGMRVDAPEAAKAMKPWTQALEEKRQERDAALRSQKLIK